MDLSFYHKKDLENSNGYPRHWSTFNEPSSLGTMTGKQKALIKCWHYFVFAIGITITFWVLDLC